MTISPCAMLMTPITPKVMASPIAASRSTEPRERPYQAFCRIRRHQRQAAERGLHDPPQTVIEPHRREVGGHAARNGPARFRVDQLIGPLANENALLSRAEEESPLLQRADHLRGERIAA